MRRKKVDKRFYLPLAILVIIILLVIYSFTVNNREELTIPEKIIRDVFYSVSDVVLIPFNFIGDKINDYKEYNDLYDEYEILKSNLSEYEKLDLENKELRAEIEELNKSLGIDFNLSEYEEIPATIISRNLNYWHNTISINKGELDGVSIGDAVVTNEGLVGRVITTSYLTSTIKLLTTDIYEEKISTAIFSVDKEYGLIYTYNQDKSRLLIEGVSNTVTINIGDEVATSGLGGDFPSGILIGHVSAVETDAFDLAKTIYVQPSVDFDNLKYVTVLKRGDSKWFYYQL